MSQSSVSVRSVRRARGGVAIVRIVDKDAGALLYTHLDAVFADDGGGFGCQRQTSVAHGCRDAECKVALA